MYSTTYIHPYMLHTAYCVGRNKHVPVPIGSVVLETVDHIHR